MPSQLRLFLSLLIKREVSSEYSGKIITKNETLKNNQVMIVTTKNDVMKNGRPKNVNDGLGKVNPVIYASNRFQPEKIKPIIGISLSKKSAKQS